MEFSVASYSSTPTRTEYAQTQMQSPSCWHLQKKLHNVLGQVQKYMWQNGSSPSRFLRHFKLKQEEEYL